jgi:pimeloyl-ACP methyl ester carboxylesterase
MKSIKKLLIFLAILIIAGATVGLLFWTFSTKAPDSRALDNLETREGISVIEGKGLIEFSSEKIETVGFIFYPGGGVDFRAYSPHMRLIAEQGIRVFLVDMPFNIAFLGANRAAEIIAAHPEIMIWAIGGHSLGGVAAAGFAADHIEIDALILWASYPANNALLNKDLNVLSIFGSRDGLTSIADIEESKGRLPEGAAFASIEGANHAQFGSYGAQDGDNQALISADEQARLTAGITSRFLLGLAQ